MPGILRDNNRKKLRAYVTLGEADSETQETGERDNDVHLDHIFWRRTCRIVV